MTEALARPVLSEPLTWEQICERHPEQWVVLVEIDRPEGDHNVKFGTARVAGTGKTRREPLDQARPLLSAYRAFGHYYTGPIRARLIREFVPPPAFIVQDKAELWPPQGSDDDAQASTSEPVISDPMSWNQICEKYPEQWVLLVEMEWLGTSGFEFQTARIIARGKTRDEPLAQARPWRSRFSSFCHFFTGPAGGPPPRLSW